MTSSGLNVVIVNINTEVTVQNMIRSQNVIIWTLAVTKFYNWVFTLYRHLWAPLPNSIKYCVGNYKITNIDTVEQATTMYKDEIIQKSIIFKEVGCKNDICGSNLNIIYFFKALTWDRMCVQLCMYMKWKQNIKFQANYVIINVLSMCYFVFTFHWLSKLDLISEY